MAKFDMMEIKRKLEIERAQNRKPVKETLGQKILMVFVTVVSLAILYSFILSYDLSNTINYSVLAVFIVLIVLRIIQVSKRKI
ncbi:MAG: hypothetical protein JW702_03565 [Clostridiales bacterium]|nr:hypothetical protein [Clostridiales bacterium]